MGTLGTSTQAEGKKLTDVVKYEADQTHSRDELTLGTNVGFEIGDVVEIISTKAEKIVTAGNATGVYLERANTALVAALATLGFPTNPSADDEVIVNGRTYKFVVSPSTTDDIDIGSDAEESLMNLLSAINLSGTGGDVQYGTGTTVNLHVSAEILPGDVIQFRALIPGTVGNALTLTSDVSDVVLSGATFSGGQSTDQATGVILRRAATVDGTQLNYNGVTEATAKAALIALGIKVIGDAA